VWLCWDPNCRWQYLQYRYSNATFEKKVFLYNLIIVSNITKVDSTISGILAEEIIEKRLASSCPNKCMTYRLIFMDISMPL
jgi:hypothetical protein